MKSRLFQLIKLQQKSLMLSFRYENFPSIFHGYFTVFKSTLSNFCGLLYMNFKMIYGYPLRSECCSIIHSSDQYFYFSLADVENRAQPIRLNLLKPAGIYGDRGDLSPLIWVFFPIYGDFSPLTEICPHLLLVDSI